MIDMRKLMVIKYVNQCINTIIQLKIEYLLIVAIMIDMQCCV